MNKLIVSCGSFSSGGAERVLSILSQVFAEHYDEVLYISWINTPDFYTFDQRIKRICIERECGSSILLVKSIWFRKYVCKVKPSAVLSFLAPYNVLVSFSLLGLGVKLIVAERNDPRYIMNGLIKRTLRKVAYIFADGILQQTDNNRKYFKGYLFRKTHVIYNPIIMEEGYRGRALQTQKQKKVVSVARLKKQKNPEMQLLAFREFLEKFPEYSMFMFGEGDYKPQIEEMISRLGLEGKVFLPGAVKDVWNEIVNADCFIMSSWYEGMPNALLEAMCLGLPCISTRVSGAVDFIISGKNGLLVNLDDHHAMAEAMSEICSNADYGAYLGNNAMSLYNLLNIDVISKQWIDYIDKIIDI